MYKITNGYISDIGAWNLDIVCYLSLRIHTQRSACLTLYGSFKINDSKGEYAICYDAVYSLNRIRNTLLSKLAVVILNPGISAVDSTWDPIQGQAS